MERSKQATPSMSQTNHTIGPWVAVQLACTPGRSRVQLVGADNSAALIVDFSNEPEHEATGWANMRLVCSAPVLLSALHAIASMDPGDPAECLALTRAMARIAIDTAERP